MIEIKELFVKINIESRGNNNTNTTSNISQKNTNKEELLEECLEQISILLKNKKER